MPSLVNRIPRGLLGLLDLKATGRNPSVLPDTIDPSVDLTQFYREEVAVRVQGTTIAATGLGLFGATQASGDVYGPPGGELWLCDGMTISRPNAISAATSYTFCLVVYEIQTGAVVRGSPLVSTTTGEAMIVNWDGPIFVAPGYQVGIWVKAFALGTATQFFIASRIAKLKI